MLGSVIDNPMDVSPDPSMAQIRSIVT